MNEQRGREGLTDTVIK